MAGVRPQSERERSEGVVKASEGLSIPLTDPGEARGPADKRSAAGALAARERHGTDVGLAAVAADATAGQPPGTVYLGLSFGRGPHAGEHVQRVVLPGDRGRLREYTVISLLNYLRGFAL